MFGVTLEGEAQLAVFGWDEAVGSILPSELLGNLLLLEVLEAYLLLSHPPHTSTSE